MKRTQKKSAKDKSFERLLGVHAKALQENSDSLIDILEVLAEKHLSASDKKQVKAIKKELANIDKKLDNLGKGGDIIGDNPYGFGF